MNAWVETVERDENMHFKWQQFYKGLLTQWYLTIGVVTTLS